MPTFGESDEEKRQRLLRAAAAPGTTAVSGLMATPGEREQQRQQQRQQRTPPSPPSAMQQAQERAAYGQALALPQMPQMPQRVLVPNDAEEREARKRAHQEEINKLEQSIVLGNQKLQQKPNNTALRQSVEAAQSRLLELNAVDTDTTLESAMPTPGSLPGWF